MATAKRPRTSWHVDMMTGPSLPLCVLSVSWLPSSSSNNTAVLTLTESNLQGRKGPHHFALYLVALLRTGEKTVNTRKHRWTKSKCSAKPRKQRESFFQMACSSVRIRNVFSHISVLHSSNEKQDVCPPRFQHWNFNRK